MTLLFQILLYLWIAITSMLLVTWYLRHRSTKADRSPDPNPALVGFEGSTEPQILEPVAHPAFIGSWDRSTSAEPAGFEDESTDDPIIGGDPTFATTTTTTAIDVVTSDGVEGPTSDDDPESSTAVESSTRDEGWTDHEGSTPEEGSESSTLPCVDHRTLFDMLDGIKLPYDLTPITSAVEDPDRHLIFLTTHSNAEEVGTRFADEITRLGYTFTPVGLDRAIATRGDDSVSMTIVPKANEVMNANGPRYGAAGAGDVALEVWVGRSSNPPALAPSSV
ncbi:MAG: hypothetical protein OER95_11090 [Acidimicrobiia bacterium]|nr:hypothetical protein [Acidimicrobiia bacterium]